MEQGRALYDHVLGRLKHDKSGSGWGRGDAQYACDARAGNCYPLLEVDGNPVSTENQFTFRRVK